MNPSDTPRRHLTTLSRADYACLMRLQYGITFTLNKRGERVTKIPASVTKKQIRGLRNF